LSAVQPVAKIKHRAAHRATALLPWLVGFPSARMWQHPPAAHSLQVGYGDNAFFIASPLCRPGWSHGVLTPGGKTVTLSLPGTFMMTRSKRRMLLGMSVAAALTLLLILIWFVLPKEAHQESAYIKSHDPQTDQYAIRTKLTDAGNGIARVDGSFQFTFSGDARISPGSLKEMTNKMREAEIEIATQLNRKIEIP
jgi:hypothetical protein